MNDHAPLGLLDFARLLIEALEGLRTPYMLGGALAVMAYAEARATQDVDLVVSLPLEQADRFSRRLAQLDVLIPPELILERFERPEFDLPLSGVHLYSGQRADIYLLLPGDTLRASALARRRRVDLGPTLGPVDVHSPEDLILYKLRYFAISEQDKHVRDIAAILLAQEQGLDLDYIQSWVVHLGLANYWQRIRTEVERRRQA